jgi:5-formyltetrahydrofolate cyclo-ligase
MAGSARCAQQNIPEAIHSERGLSLVGFRAGTYGSHLTYLASADFHANGRSGPATRRHKRPIALTTEADRKQLRRTARAARSAFAGALALPIRRALESALTRTLQPLLTAPPHAGAVLASYAAAGDEIDPAQVELAARASGWRIAFPRVTGEALAFHLADRAALRPGFKGLPEPDPGAPPARPDALLVPLLAADRAGTRLGQGGGHYDRTLAALRAHAAPFAVGLAWDVQLTDHLPAFPWDQPLDAVATPTAFHRVAPGAKNRA